MYVIGGRRFAPLSWLPDSFSQQIQSRRHTNVMIQPSRFRATTTTTTVFFMAWIFFRAGPLPGK
jgi:hypothetical protein